MMASTRPHHERKNWQPGEMGHVAQFRGGDKGLRNSLDRMYTDNAAQIEQQHGGPSPALAEFI
jgi:MerR family transcriptional regulator, thiopeptide resistance regulator